MMKSELKIIVQLILWKLIFISVAFGYNTSSRGIVNHLVRHKRDESPEILKIKYYHDNQEDLVILKKVFSVIPSASVPIWNIQGGRQESHSYFIENLETICYHGVHTFSAVTYFPHTNTLHGVIDYRFYIESLPLAHINNPELTSAFIHPMANNTGNRVPNFLDRKKRSGNKRKISTDTKASSRKRFKSEDEEVVPRSVLYPEILLVLDTTEHIDATQEVQHEKAIMYALAYWNAVDMLFRHLKRTDIRINIAGIFVGKTEDVLDHILLRRSLYFIDNNSHAFMLRDGALNSLGEEFHEHGHGLKRDSFDFLVWMTRASLTGSKTMYNEGGPHLGMAAPAADCGGRRDKETRLKIIMNRAVVMHDDRFAEYQTAARELAHMMFVSDDDVVINHGCHVQKNCLVSDPMFPSSGIMDPANKRVEGCLMWSYCSEIYFERYAKSESSCCLLNFPYRSFGGPPVSVETLTVQRQCQCYGLQQPEQVNCQPNICHAPLYCRNENGHNVEVGLPLDGTPCLDRGESGICNQNTCIPD